MGESGDVRAADLYLEVGRALAPILPLPGRELLRGRPDMGRDAVGISAILEEKEHSRERLQAVLCQTECPQRCQLREDDMHPQKL